MHKKIKDAGSRRLWDTLASMIPGYSERPQQIELFNEIVSAINDNKILLAEGPCGVGKSLAGILGFLASRGRRVVICTANNSQLAQYYSKDLPFAEDLASICDMEVDWIMIQGKQNYMCPARWSAVREKLNILSDEKLRRLAEYVDSLDGKMEHWLGHIEDMSKYDWIRETLTIPSGRCKMSNCKFCESCEMFRSRQSSKYAEIVITNYHMWILDTMQRFMLAGEEGFIPTLGEYDVLIFDEAHELPHVARDYFKLEIGDNFISSALKYGSASSKSMLRLAWAMYKESFDDIKDGYVHSFPVDKDVSTALANALSSIYTDIKEGSSKDDSDFKMMEAIERRVSLCGSALLGDVSTDTHAYGIEREEVNGHLEFKLECVEISTGDILRRLYNRDIPIIAMSATICTSPGDFKFMSNMLGFDLFPERLRTSAVDSPFDFSRSLVFTMNDSPDPNEDTDKWIEYCYMNLKSAIISLGGRTLALFTSTKRMGAVARLLKMDDDIKTPIFAQGDMANSALVSEFRDNPSASLLGVASFWTGIDIKGESLSLLWIERVPFKPPTDLVTVAMSTRMEKGQAFFKFSVPDAIMRLKQGAGRLIRSNEDRGIVVFADGRVEKARYGKKVLRSILSGASDSNSALKKSGSTKMLSQYCNALRKRLDSEG